MGNCFFIHCFIKEYIKNLMRALQNQGFWSMQNLDNSTVLQSPRN